MKKRLTTLLLAFALVASLPPVFAQTDTKSAPKRRSKADTSTKAGKAKAEPAKAEAAKAEAAKVAPAKAETAKTSAKAVQGASNAEIGAAKSAGKVWVNTDTKVYHKGGRWYGKTKEGKFMTEDEAKRAGFTAAKSEIGSKK